MKLLALITVLFSNDLMAHNDEFLGKGSVHLLFHLLFWVLVGLCAYQGANYYKAKNKSTKQSGK